MPLRSRQAPNGGRAAHDGTDGRFDWQEIVPHELMPHVIGPQRDFLYSANHRPIGSFYSIPLGISTGGGGHTVRSWRLDELMAAREQFAPQDVLDIHFDSVNPALRDIVRLGYHLRDMQEAPLADETLRALEHLEEWLAQGASSDLGVAGAEVATRINTLFRAGNTDLAARFGGGQSGLVAFLRATSQRLERDSASRLDRLELAFVDQALSAAWTKAARELGRDSARWPERARAAVEEAKMGYFQGLHGFPSLDSRYDLQVPALTTLDGSTIKSQRGQSYTQFVPLDNPDRALSLLPIGQSEHPTSPFRTSAMDLWARGELHPAPLSRQAVENFSISVEVLEPLGGDTAVREEQSACLPGAFALHQNYPNPFNSTTKIAYDLPQAGKVKLSIYAATGQLVRVFHWEHGSGGAYSIAWDGTDRVGRTLASGVYLYRLNSGSNVAEKKLNLLR